MRSWPDVYSPWGKQLRFDDHEFESMMDELRHRAGEDCFSPGRGVDVDLVLLKAVGTEADYVDLPNNVMGRTTFSPAGHVTIEVSRSLAEHAAVDTVARRRLRTTLAHECGHVACHTCLFVRDTETFSLFSEASAPAVTAKAPIMCRAEGVGNVGYKGEWWEFQANRCMASLLLPRRKVSDSVRKRLADGGFKSGEECIASGNGEALVRSVADEYDVSQTAVLYRLQDLGFIPKGAQRQIRLSE